MNQYESIRQVIQPELHRLEAKFTEALHSQVALTRHVVQYLMQRRGKQLRPLVTLLAAKLIRGTVNDDVLLGAISLELVHNASLLHDDVVDESDQRRGNASVNRLWDNKVAVLVGDFFLSKCLLTCNRISNPEAINILAQMVANLSEGELEQLSNTESDVLSEDRYFRIIRGKTASLFEACMQMGGVCVGADADELQRLTTIGEHMGLVFQIRDDIFDYYPSTEAVGKPTGHDIREHKITLPLLYALQHTTPQQNAPYWAILRQAGPITDSQAESLIAFAKQHGGIEYATRKMHLLAQVARDTLSTFPDSESRSALLSLLDYFIVRDK